MRQSFFSQTIVVFFLVLDAIMVCSQSNLPLGEWKSHLSYKEGKIITQSRNKVIYASEKGLFTVDKDDNSVSFYSKEDGFSDININGLYYDRFNEQLIIIYTDNNIDIWKGGEIFNISSIVNNTNILSSKTVNDVYIANENFAYLATDFGILGFNLKSLEFAFTTFTELKVYAVAEYNGNLYAGTEDGLYTVGIKGNNLSDFNVWKELTTKEGLPQSFETNALAVQSGKLYALINNQIFSADNTGFFSVIPIGLASNEKINFLSDQGTEIMAGLENNNNSSRILFIDANNNIKERGYGCINRAVYAIEDEKGRIWYADQWDPVRYTEGKVSGDCKKLSFPVPYTNEASNIKFKNNKAYFASNGLTEDYQYKFTRYGFYTLRDNKWENFNENNIALMREKEFINLFTLAPHPKTSDLYLGSYYSGIMRYNEDTKDVQLWNKDNSILQGVTGDEARTRIAGLTFDKDENLWISNFGAPKPLAVKTKDNAWYNFSVPGSSNLADIVIDTKGNKWIVVVGVGNGVIVYNEGDKIGDPSDDRIRYITRNNSEISGNKVNSLVVDLDGAVWIGTDQGPVVFDCGDPFAESCRGNIRKVVVGGIPALLLRDEDILCMDVDGGNRKWFGTRNGIFVQSPDGTTQVARFDSKNSPLLSNKVTDLAFNPLSGEMFIVSSGGIQSYKTETTSGGRVHSTNVYTFPNPVRPDYNGPIAIKGLVRDANVKITDINGKLVYETKALGGQAVWNGRDYNGIKASTGVYLVFSANENTSLPQDALVTKILIVD